MSMGMTLTWFDPKQCDVIWSLHKTQHSMGKSGNCLKANHLCDNSG